MDGHNRRQEKGLTGTVFVFAKKQDAGAPRLICPIDAYGLKGEEMSTSVEPHKGVFT
ncbi:MAG: hypothetical protein AAFX99_06355 [Myxococcota bacterium]